MTTSELASHRLCRLLEPIYPEARQLARRLARSDADGDDIFHTSLERALRRIGDLRDDGAFRLWLFRIMTSVHHNRHRSWLARWVGAIRDDENSADARVDADDRAGAERMRRALALLPAEQAQAIALCDVHGLSVEEAAAAMEASIPAIKSRLSRGRRRLRKIYIRRFGVVATARGVAEMVS
jgi:RNA polymerase sigma-70 factor, ECF subfamily